MIVPPAGGAAEDHRLPIYEAVESDWFTSQRGTSGSPAPAGGAWTSPADVGWRAAQAAAAPVSSGVTSAGLPVRVPQANIVPGAVASQNAQNAQGAQNGQPPQAAPPSPEPELPARSATAARDRFARFQQGVSQGRAAASSAAADGEDETA